MSALSSLLSLPISAELVVLYTNPFLVSETTGGEVLPEEVQPEWIDWAMEEIEKRSGMCFRPLPFTDVLDGTGSDDLFTSCFPVLEITRVEEDGVEIPPSAYVVNKRTGKVTLRSGRFSEGLQNVHLSGTYGKLQVPALVQKIATLLVAKTALAAKNGALVDNESLGDFSQTRSFKKLNDQLDEAFEALGRRFPLDFV
ncbi:MAG: hypothetical protein HY548_06410 [Elusimicrobia bacterium]|nr:hypothetical protein [Elusimicrobiota bacterium]